MDLKELRGMEQLELHEKGRQLKQELFNLRFQLATGRIENPMRIREVRRSIAQVQTILHEKAVASSEGRTA